MLGSLLHPSSYLGFFLFVALTGCGLPIPEEAAIVVAGVLSSQQQLNWPIAFAVCLAGAIVGDSFMYGIGHHWGHGIFTSHPRFAKLFATENEQQFQKAVEAHALKVMLIARFLIGIRAPVYVMTGVVRLPFYRFVVYDIMSATLVVSVVFGLSYLFGEQVAGWVHHTEFWATIIVVLIVIAVVAILYYRHREQVLNVVFGRDVPPADEPIVTSTSDDRYTAQNDASAKNAVAKDGADKKKDKAEEAQPQAEH